MTLAPAWTSARIVGIAARMRESSVTLPSASGTLKSTRTNTRLPATSASRIVSFSMRSVLLGGDVPPAGDRRRAVAGVVGRVRRPRPAAGPRRRR